MSERPRLFDDLAGVAGGAFSAFAGAREEFSALVRSRVDEILSQLQLVRREEFEVVRDMASLARVAQLNAETRIAALEARLAAAEALPAAAEYTYDASGAIGHSGDEPGTQS